MKNRLKKNRVIFAASIICMIAVIISGCDYSNSSESADSTYDLNQTGTTTGGGTTKPTVPDGVCTADGAGFWSGTNSWASSATWSNTAPANGNVTVLNWNVLDLSDTSSVTTMMNFVTTYSVEILVLEEFVADNDPRISTITSSLTTKWGGSPYYISLKRVPSGSYDAENIAVFSKYPIVETECNQIKLSDTSVYYQVQSLGTYNSLRPVLNVKITLPDGNSLRVMGCHLKATTSSPASDYARRLNQAKSLAKYLKETYNLNSTGDRIIVCGDMNTTTNAGGYSDFAPGSTLYYLTRADDCYESNNLIPVNYRYKHEQFTHLGTGEYPSVTFDYIMLSPAAMQNYVTNSVLVVNSPMVSDHYPVIMSMNVP